MSKSGLRRCHSNDTPSNICTADTDYIMVGCCDGDVDGVVHALAMYV